MIRSTDITSITDHRQHLREHLDRVKRTGRPLYVTSNGETEAVVLSARAFDELADRADMAPTLAMIARSEADIEAGKAKPMRETLKAVARKQVGKRAR